MKNVKLLISVLFLFSSGMAASAAEREECAPPSRVRAAAVKTDQEKYEILCGAEDHMIKLPPLATVSPELLRIPIMGPYLLERSLKNLFEDSKLPYL